MTLGLVLSIIVVYFSVLILISVITSRGRFHYVFYYRPAVTLAPGGFGMTFPFFKPHPYKTCH